MNVKEFSKLFPLGSHLCREPMPAMSELKRDMELLRRGGFNLVKLQEHWQVDEPLEGRYDFSRCEELIEHAARLDMGVYVGLTCEQAPHWLWEKHPLCRMVGRNGVPIAYEAQSTLPGDGKPGPCFDHDGARADMLRFIGKLVASLGRFESVVVWNTWQEIGYWAEHFAGQGVCYCPATIEHWRRWLRETYGDLDGLNRAWNSRHLDWSQVVPDRVAMRAYPSPVELDWRHFMDNAQVAAVLRARAEVIRRADPLHRPVFAHKGGLAYGSGVDWVYARCQDFLGCSAYPAWGSLHKWDDGREKAGPLGRHEALSAETWDLMLKYDYLRCCNAEGAPVWAAEFQGGPVSTGFHMGRVPSSDDIRRWMLTAVGCGVTAISFWVTRAEIAPAEANGFGLLDSQGDSTARLAEAARVGAALGRHADLFAAASGPRAETAIVVDERNHQFCGCLSQGGENLGYDIRGWHRLLCEAGVGVDFVEAGELGERAGRYKAIIVPFALLMSERTAERLASYVKAGGTLICEAAAGRFDEHGYCRRGEMPAVLAELFGARQESFTMVREPGGASRWSPAERTWGEYLDAAMLEGEGPLAGRRLRANVYVQTFVPAGGQACLRHGAAVAGVVNRAGAGQAWLLGTFVGHGGTAYRDEATRACVSALLERAGVRPARAGRLLVRKRSVPGKEAWVLFNPTGDEVTERVSVAGRTSVEDLLAGELAVRDGSVTLTVPSLDVRVLMLSGDEHLS